MSRRLRQDIGIYFQDRDVKLLHVFESIDSGGDAFIVAALGTCSGMDKCTRIFNDGGRQQLCIGYRIPTRAVSGNESPIVARKTE